MSDTRPVGLPRRSTEPTILRDCLLMAYWCEEEGRGQEGHGQGGGVGKVEGRGQEGVWAGRGCEQGGGGVGRRGCGQGGGGVGKVEGVWARLRGCGQG